MKLRNLLFGTMIACAFVACSNDDDPIDNGGGNENPTGKTLLQVSPNVITTKANVAGDAFKVYVMDAAGKIVADGPVNEAFEITSTEAEGRVEILVLKNMPFDGPVTTKSDLLQKISFSKSEEDYTDNANSQNTACYSVDVVRGMLNKLGYENHPVAGVNYLDKSGKAIPAFRNVAKIWLNSVVLENNVITGKDVKYVNPKLKVREVFILNARKSSYMANGGSGLWGTTEYTADKSYLNGVDNNEFNVWLEDAQDNHSDAIYIHPEAGAKFAPYYEEDWNTNNTLFTGYRRGQWILRGDKKLEEVILDANNVNKNKWVTSGSGMFFTYENTSETNPTLLVVKGDFSFDVAAGNPENPNKTERKTLENRFYTIPLGISGLTTANTTWLKEFGIKDISEIKGVRRNIMYNLELTVKGPGSKNPLYPGDDEDTEIGVAVELIDYGMVNQNPSID